MGAEGGVWLGHIGVWLGVWLGMWLGECLGSACEYLGCRWV